MKISLRLILWAALMTACLSAQSTLGTITGVVTDKSGSVIPSAVVVATNTATGVRAQTVTSGTGNYVIPNLQVGRYDISVAVTGFKSFERSGINLSSDDNIRVDVVLEIGATTERVVVTAEAPPLKTESSEVSTTMERKLVNDVPLAVAGIGGGMRNAFSIMMMMPQVKSGNGESAWDDLQVGGGQQHDWNVSVDGCPSNGLAQPRRLHEPADALGRFRRGVPNRDLRIQGGKQPRQRRQHQRNHEVRNKRTPRKCSIITRAIFSTPTAG